MKVTEDNMDYLLKQYDKIKDNMWVCVDKAKADRKEEEENGWAPSYRFGKKPKPVPNTRMEWVKPTFREFCNTVERHKWEEKFQPGILFKPVIAGIKIIWSGDKTYEYKREYYIPRNLK